MKDKGAREIVNLSIDLSDPNDKFTINNEIYNYLVKTSLVLKYGGGPLFDIEVLDNFKDFIDQYKRSENFSIDLSKSDFFQYLDLSEEKERQAVNAIISNFLDNSKEINNINIIEISKDNFDSYRKQLENSTFLGKEGLEVLKHSETDLRIFIGLDKLNQSINCFALLTSSKEIALFEASEDYSQMVTSAFNKVVMLDYLIKENFLSNNYWLDPTEFLHPSSIKLGLVEKYGITLIPLKNILSNSEGDLTDQTYMGQTYFLSSESTELEIREKCEQIASYATNVAEPGSMIVVVQRDIATIANLGFLSDKINLSKYNEDNKKYIKLESLRNENTQFLYQPSSGMVLYPSYMSNFPDKKAFLNPMDIHYKLRQILTEQETDKISSRLITNTSRLDNFILIRKLQEEVEQLTKDNQLSIIFLDLENEQNPYWYSRTKEDLLSTMEKSVLNVNKSELTQENSFQKEESFSEYGQYGLIDTSLLEQDSFNKNNKLQNQEVTSEGNDYF